MWKEMVNPLPSERVEISTERWAAGGEKKKKDAKVKVYLG